MFNIGKLEIKSPLFLAPMAGVTDHPFRVLCKQYGAGVVYTEFVSANGDQINMYDFLIANSPDPNLLAFILDQASLDTNALNGQRGLMQLLLDRDNSME